MRILKGRLLFDRAGTSEIAYTVSRYRRKPVQSQGKQVRNISADINIQDIDQFLRGLPNIAPVKQQETPHTHCSIPSINAAIKGVIR